MWAPVCALFLPFSAPPPPTLAETSWTLTLSKPDATLDANPFGFGLNVGNRPTRLQSFNMNASDSVQPTKEKENKSRGLQHSSWVCLKSASLPPRTCCER